MIQLGDRSFVYRTFRIQISYDIIIRNVCMKRILYETSGILIRNVLSVYTKRLIRNVCHS